MNAWCCLQAVRVWWKKSDVASTNRAAIRKGRRDGVMCSKKRPRYECPADECTDQIVLCFYIIRVGSDSEWKCKVVDD